MRWLLLALLLALPALADEGQAGLVTEFQGSATLHRAGGQQKVHNVMILEPGDEVDLAAKARLTAIFFEDGHREVAVGPGRIRITPKGMRGTPKITRSGPSRAQIPPNARLERMAGRILKIAWIEEDAPQPVPYLAGDQPPTLRWTGGTPPFTVKVEGLWEATTDERALRWAGPPLEPDTSYVYEVSDAHGVGYGQFRVLSTRSMASLERAEAWVRQNPRDLTRWVLLMSAYTAHDWLDRAIDAGRRATAAHPKDGGLHLALSKLLREAGRTEEAQAEARRARALGAGD